MTVLSATAGAGPVDALSGLSFLVGSWQGDDGKVSDTGGTSRGTSVVTSEVGGALLLRRDHTDLFDRGGKPVGGFDQLMTIYAEGGSIHADYVDGEHVIHYTNAEVIPGKSVTFSTPANGGPVFRLSYRADAPETLTVTFGMVPPGQSALRPIATGTLHKR